MISPCRNRSSGFLQGSGGTSWTTPIRAVALFGPLRPIVLVLEDANDARALAAGVLLHLDQDRKALGQRRARLVFLLERQQLAVVAVDIGPDALVVLDLDLEHVAGPWKRSRYRNRFPCRHGIR